MRAERSSLNRLSIIIWSRVSIVFEAPIVGVIVVAGARGVRGELGRGQSHAKLSGVDAQIVVYQHAVVVEF